MMAKDQQKPISRNYAVKSDDDPKTNKTNILVYALKAMMAKNRTKPISRNYAVKSDNDPKTNKPISLSMLLKAIMTQKPNL